MNFSDPTFIADLCGFILSLPISLFLAFWLSAVKNRFAVIAGAFVGTLIAAFAILAWAGTLFYSKPLPGMNYSSNGAAVFFGSVLLCSIAGLIGGILIDLLVGRINNRDYRRRVAHE